jgi:hypothetical protein
MSNVIHLAPAPAPQEKSPFGQDEWLLKLCARWRVERATQQKLWAEYDIATRWGTQNANVDTEPLRRMMELEDILATAQPRTALLAHQLLGIANTILAYQREDPDPESNLAKGPVLEIVRNVAWAIGFLEPTQRLGSNRRRKP